MKSKATGHANEIVVIINDGYWNSQVGDKLREQLGGYMFGLPQLEKAFSLYNYQHARFNKTHKTHRNIIIIDIEDIPGNANAKFVDKSDIWARDQIVYELNASDPQAMLDLLDEKLASITASITAKEVERLSDLYAVTANKGIQTTLKATHSYSINVPGEAEIRENNDNFVWITYSKSQ